MGTKTPRRYAYGFVFFCSIAIGAATADELKSQARINPTPTPWSYSGSKTYQRLSAEDLAELQAAYEFLPPEDEPPFPINGMGPIMESMMRVGATMRLEGHFFASVRVDAHGDAKSIEIYKTPDEKLNRSAAFILVVSTKYKPALCSGSPCEMAFPVFINWAEP